MFRNSIFRLAFRLTHFVLLLLLLWLWLWLLRSRIYSFMLDAKSNYLKSQTQLGATCNRLINTIIVITNSD